MVKESIGKSLSLHQHIHLFVLAAMNAFCEEVTCRGFWRAEYSKYTTRANLWQATLFGIWHYHGIPSGWTGVGLTFVYGTIMGWLQDYFGGLLMPILAHALADYFIFSVIARNEKQPNE
jgi:membrane protease YdiL (CAAX protease family)